MNQPASDLPNPKPELLVLARLSSEATMDALEQDYVCHHLWQVDEPSRDEYIGRVAPGVRGVVTNGGVGIRGELLRRLPSLEIVSVFGVGVDAVDLEAARARKVCVTNTPDVLTDDVADLAMALLLAANRRLCALDRFVRSGSWVEGKNDLVAPPSLRNKSVGIYGFGRIGRTVARRLEPFGVTLRYFQPRPVEGTDVPRATSLLELAEASTYLVVCAAATPQTRGAVDASVLRALGGEGVLVNIARGSIVDEPALVEALSAGALGYAALDVFADEPHVPPELLALDNVTLTPHVASMTVETLDAMGRLVTENLGAHFAGRELLTPVV